MIGFLRGKIVQLLTDYCLIDVMGVGYRVFVTATTRAKLRVGEEATIYTYMSVREDDISLYGFATQEEYDMFQLLITVSGIGPKVALGALSASTPDRISIAIAQKQSAVLTKLPGIGKKSAERLILELKDKVKISSKSADTFDIDEGEGLFKPEPPIANDVFSEAEAALRSMGYSQQEASTAIRKVEKDLAKAKKKAANVQEVIKLSLAQFLK